MKGIIFIAICFLALTSGCSLGVLPVEYGNNVISGNVVISNIENSISIKLDNTTIDYAPSVLNQHLITIHTEVSNRGNSGITINNDSVYITDMTGNIYRIEDLSKQKAEQSSYLLPYPYVGYYYINDTVSSEYRDSYNKSLSSYSHVNYDHMIESQFKFGIIPPNSVSSGLLAFSFDPYVVREFDLIFNFTDTSGEIKSTKFRYKVID